MFKLARKVAKIRIEIFEKNYGLKFKQLISFIFLSIYSNIALADILY